MASLPEVNAIVLAGGRSLRLGRDKRLEEVGGVPLLERVLSALAPLSREVLIITAEEERLPLKAPVATRWLADRYPGKGSLGGIYTGLAASSTYHNLVVACDMPFLSQPLLSYLISQAPGFDLVIPRVKGYAEPLHAIYSKDCLCPIEELIHRNTLQIIALFPAVRVRYIEEAEVDRFDPEHRSFFNINTQEDQEQARLWLGAAQAPGR